MSRASSRIPLISAKPMTHHTNVMDVENPKNLILRQAFRGASVYRAPFDFFVDLVEKRASNRANVTGAARPGREHRPLTQWVRPRAEPLRGTAGRMVYRRRSPVPG